jgi:hypothetical protein
VKGKFYFIFHLTWTNTFVKYDKNKLLEKWTDIKVHKWKLYFKNCHLIQHTWSYRVISCEGFPKLSLSSS